MSFASGTTLPMAADTLTVVSANATPGGSFANVPSGRRLNTTDGLGSFVVIKIVQ